LRFLLRLTAADLRSTNAAVNVVVYAVARAGKHIEEASGREPRQPSGMRFN
jgi:hypothetical protein